MSVYRVSYNIRVDTYPEICVEYIIILAADLIFKGCEVIVNEIPLLRGVVLKYFQTIVDPFLHLYHTRINNKKKH